MSSEVLIGPYWNVNVVVFNEYVLSHIGFNRTILECKLEVPEKMRDFLTKF